MTSSNRRWANQLRVRHSFSQPWEVRASHFCSLNDNLALIGSVQAQPRDLIYFLGFRYHNLELHLPLLFIDAELSWKAVLFGAIGLVGLQLLGAIAKFCWMKSTLSNTVSDSKEASDRKEEIRTVRAILEAQAETFVDNNALFIQKAVFGHFGNRPNWSLEDLEWQVEGDTIQVVEDITAFLRLYNQGERVDIPAEKWGLVGFDHLLHSTVAGPQIFIAYRGASDDPRELTCKVFDLDQPIHIQV